MNTDTTKCCCLPPVPQRKLSGLADDRAQLIRTLEKKWMSGTELTYRLIGGSSADRNTVRQAFDVWADTGIGISFTELHDTSDATLRIGFVHGDGSWSYVGTDNLNIPKAGERTMNFGWSLARDPRGIDVALHEIGHALGFPHEHQNPFSGIQWNEDEVYRRFGGAPNNWTRGETYWNVLHRFSPSEVEGSDWDPDSVMHYGFGAGLIASPAQYAQGLSPAGGLSAKDIAQALAFFPATVPRLDMQEMQALVVDIEPGEQINLNILADHTNDFEITTFGNADVVMQLYSEGTLLHEDDDSGVDRNSLIRARLVAGVEYVVKLRLYYRDEEGRAGVVYY